MTEEIFLYTKESVKWFVRIDGNDFIKLGLAIATFIFYNEKFKLDLISFVCILYGRKWNLRCQEKVSTIKKEVIRQF